MVKAHILVSCQNIGSIFYRIIQYTRLPIGYRKRKTPLDSRTGTGCSVKIVPVLEGG